jgi:heat shock protein HslJ
MEKKMKKLFVSLLVVFILAACAGGTSASINGKWKLVSHGPASKQTPAAPQVDTTIEFKSDGTLSGNVGCNNFSGNFKAKGDSLTFGPVASTMMFCEGPVGDQELTTVAVLQTSAKFVLDGDKLTITSADGKSVIVLEKK